MSQNIPAEDSPVFLVTVLNRGQGEKVMKLFSEEGAAFHLLVLGRGTADSKVLAYLGLGVAEKEILLSILPLKLSKRLLQKLNEEFELKNPGRGIAFTIPVRRSHKHLEETYWITGGESMEQPEQELIVAIANQGFSDDVMTAAKSAGATGGTILHGRGIGSKEAEKFFGVTVQPERELVLILARKEAAPGILKAVSERAGLHTEAGALVFSLPVNGIAGLSALPGEKA